MSYSANRRDALDVTMERTHRGSHARSCANLVASKWGVHRDEVMQRVRERTGVDMTRLMSDEELQKAIACLDELKAAWVSR